MKNALAGQAAELVEGAVAVSADPVHWINAAEDCVLTRLKGLRLIGGLPRHKKPLSPETRKQRLETLLGLWANGCTCAVDEDLFADILQRHKQVS